MAAIGEALLAVTDAYRINYEILGNTDAALHAHIVPRYLSEPDADRARPIWLYDRSVRNSRPFDAARDGALVAAIRQQLASRGLTTA
jgi:diadenosine tetraphosphate (Ap4A) HIT family hydrolase